jgi:hypothetical protein
LNGRRHGRHYPDTVREGQIRFNPIWDRYEGIGETMPKLAAAANLAADWSCDWAQLGNCEFDPSIPRSNPQQ